MKSSKEQLITLALQLASAVAVGVLAVRVVDELDGIEIDREVHHHQTRVTSDRLDRIEAMLRVAPAAAPRPPAAETFQAAENFIPEPEPEDARPDDAPLPKRTAARTGHKRGASLAAVPNEGQEATQ